MSNGESHVEKYARLSVEEHLHQLDNELDALEKERQVLLERWGKKITWTLTTFVSLIVLVCGTLLAVVVRN